MKKGVLSFLMLAATLLLKAQNPYPILPIDSVQFVSRVRLDSAAANTFPDYIFPSFKNSTYRDTVRFEGVVISNPRIYGLSTNRKAAYIQRKGGGPWSGALVMCEPAGIVPSITLPNLISETKFYDNFIVGYKVRVTGVIRHFQGETQINLIRDNANWTNSVEQLSLTPDTLVYTDIAANQLMTGNPATTWVQQKATAEQYEGTLVNIRNVTVYSIQQSGNRTFWSVIDDFGNVLDIRDASAYFRRDDNEDTIPRIANTFQPPGIGTRLDYIRGVVTEYSAGTPAVQRYGIIPIYPNDVGPCNVCPPKVLNITQIPNVAISTDSVSISARVTGDTTIRSVTLHYTNTSGNIFNIDTMRLSSTPDVYVGKIPPYANGTVVRYFVRALDNRSLRTTIPDSMATNSNYLVTDNGINDIRVLQFSNVASGASIWDGDSLPNIDVRGIITANNLNAGATRLLTLQNGTGRNAAIFIQRAVADDAAANWNVGDSVSITNATVRESFGITTLNNVRGVVISRNNPLPAFADTLSIDSFVANRIAYARPYEGVLVKWNSVYITNINPDAPSDNGEWSFHSDTTKTGLRVDDMSLSLRNFNDTIRRGQMLSYVQGPMYFSFNNFKMAPRYLTDIDRCDLDTSKPRLTLLGNSLDSFEVGGEYIESGATATDDRDGSMTSLIKISGTVNGDSIGTYVLVYRVNDYCGNMADSVIRTIKVIDSSSVGMRENEWNNASFAVYPNPASEQITISAKFIQTQPVTINVIDILGRELHKQTISGKEFTATIPTSSYNNGVYFVTISNSAGSKTLKFLVSGK